MPARLQYHCDVEGCNNIHYSKGYCNKHWQQIRKHGGIKTNTRLDFNEIVYKNIHCELVLTNMKGEEIGRAKLDTEDLEKVRKYGRWTLQLHYVYNRKHEVMMHNVVMDVKGGQYVDHIKTGNKHKSDNRKKNLRICTQTQNNQYVPKSKNNTTGFKGVTQRTLPSGSIRYIAQIGLNNTNKYIGIFDTAEEAAVAYKEQAKKHYGDFYHE